MKFKYKKLAPGLIRPIIPITLHYHNQSVTYEALVDSGADMSMFPAQIGELLGIDIKSGQKGEHRYLSMLFRSLLLPEGYDRAQTRYGRELTKVTAPWRMMR